MSGKTEPAIPPLMGRRDGPGARDDELDTPALNSPTLDAGAPPPTESEPTERERIGPYRLVHRLGEGGMGTVWLAEQDAPVRRMVALKVIKQGMDTRRVIARFQAERQALAMMDHPAIAKVLDAGQTPRGRPFFVMEYVRGVPITDYCDRHRLSLRQRLLLFRQVCEGVQHAHQKAVIHRDLKPSNILVGQEQGRPVPKIIDFGVAKATAQRLTEDTVYTELGQMIGTPDFMSPEQAQLTGEDVDTRADVYSLGAVLYVLLAGAFPVDPEELRKSGPEELRRRIRDEDPPLPSARVKSLPAAGRAATLRGLADPSTLARRLSGDLDWIVMKAMDKDRNRRYGSPQELSADLGRFLDHVPVEARPPSTIYRVAKFTRRHRTGVTLAAVVFALVIAVAVAMAFQARSLARERDQKETALAQAEAVTRFQSDMLRAVDPAVSGGDVTVREVLDSASAELEAGFDGRPLVEARVRMAIGFGYEALGLYEAAEETIRIAHTLRRGILGPDHPATLESLSGLAQVLLNQGQLREAEDLYRLALDVRTDRLGPQHLDTRGTRNSLALTYMGQGRLDEAEELLTDLLETAPEAAADEAEKAQEQTLAVTNNLAVVHHLQERYDEAEGLYRESLELQVESLGPDHPDSLVTRGNLGELLADRGDFEEAETLLTEVLRDKHEVFGDDSPSTFYTMGVLAGLYVDQGLPERARPLLREIWEHRVRNQGEDHPTTVRAREALERLETAPPP